MAKKTDILAGNKLIFIDTSKRIKADSINSAPVFIMNPNKWNSISMRSSVGLVVEVVENPTYRPKSKIRVVKIKIEQNIYECFYGPP